MQAWNWKSSYEQVDPTGEQRENLCAEQAKVILVIQAIAEKEGIEATDDNVLSYFGSEDTKRWICRIFW